VDLIQKFEAKCNPSKNSEGDFERTLECAATVACAAEWEGFRSCLDANAGEYDAKPCKVPGNLFARCLGDRGTKLLLQHDHTHSE
jgi:hypothetical protein